MEFTTIAMKKNMPPLRILFFGCSIFQHFDSSKSLRIQRGFWDRDPMEANFLGQKKKKRAMEGAL